MLHFQSVSFNYNNIAIIGSGAFACAIYSSLKNINTNNISIFFHDKSCYEECIKTGKHPKMPCYFANNTFLTTDLKEAINNKQTIFLCCVFSVATDLIDNMVNILGNESDINIIICCKGMLQERPFFLCDYAEQKMPNANIMVLSGGSFADEMCKKQNTYIDLACKNKIKAQELLSIFDEFLHIDITSNTQETELLGALKNVMAIYCGYLSKNGSTNELIGGLTNFIQSTKDVFISLNFNTDAILSQAGIGDIMLTCLSGKSRNRTFGELLGIDKNKAREYKQNTTIEGLDAIFAIKKFCDYKNVRFEMIEEMCNIIKTL